MAKPKIDLAALADKGSLTLSVAWRSGPKLKLRRVETGHEVEQAFREIVSATAKDLNARTAEAWAPDADLTPETYLVIAQDQLGSSPELSSEFQGNSLVETLAAAQNIPPLDQKLPSADLIFYAVTVDAVRGDRISFLRRTNPRRGLRSGRLFTALRDALVRIDAPIFAFDDYFDLVFASDQAAILSHSAFAALFRSQETLTAQVPRWVKELNKQVHLAPGSEELLVQRALRVTYLRTRLESIVMRGHLENLTVDDLRSAMKANDLDPDKLIDTSGQLVLEEEDIQPVLYLLNEDLFYGTLSNTPFRADKKAAR